MSAYSDRCEREDEEDRLAYCAADGRTYPLVVTEQRGRHIRVKDATGAELWVLTPRGKEENR